MSQAIVQEPDWMAIARNEIGTKEIPGEESASKIIEYHSATSLKATMDSVPWCAAFANWCLREAGFVGTDSAMARSFLKMPAQLVKPVVGCVVVLWRGTPESSSGHVGFFVSQTPKSISILGGNQSDMVCIATYPKERVIGYFWPVLRFVRQ